MDPARRGGSTGAGGLDRLPGPRRSGPRALVDIRKQVPAGVGSFRTGTLRRDQRQPHQSSARAGIRHRCRYLRSVQPRGNNTGHPQPLPPRVLPGSSPNRGICRDLESGWSEPSRRPRFRDPVALPLIRPSVRTNNSIRRRHAC